MSFIKFNFNNVFINSIRVLLLIILILINMFFTFILNEEKSYKIFKKIIKFSMEHKLFNNKINIIGDLQILKKKKYIIISNHQNANDLPILINLFEKTNCICKSNLCSDKDLPEYLSFLKYLEKVFLKSFRLVPYDRGNLDSGNKVKKIIKNKINNNENIIVFPEGKPSKNKIVKEFKSGLFRLASDNKIPIIPVTINYIKGVCIDTEDNINPLNWFNNEIEIHIHNIQLNENWEELKNNCFNLVKEPTIRKNI